MFDWFTSKPKHQSTGNLNLYSRDEFENQGHPTERDLEFELLTLHVPATFPSPDALRNKVVDYDIYPVLKQTLKEDYDDLIIIHQKLIGIPETPKEKIEVKPLYFCFHKEKGYGVVSKWGNVKGLWLTFLENM